MSKLNKVDRLVTKVFEPDTSSFISVSRLLDGVDEGVVFRLRRNIEDGLRKYLCPVCYQTLYIRGVPSRVKYHFAHRRNADECPLQESYKLNAEQSLAMEYNGQKETKAHKDGKAFIYDAIKRDRKSSFRDCKVESTFRESNPDSTMSKEWRRPDVSAVYKSEKGERKVVFELSLGSTFISVISAREDFYQINNTFVIWVLLDFDENRYTDLDIAYGNRVNVFVLSDEAVTKTLETEELWLEVHWREPEIVDEEIRYQWTSELVPFSELTFHDYYTKAYFKDVDTIEGELKARLKKQTSNPVIDYCEHCRTVTSNQTISGKVYCSTCFTPKVQIEEQA